MTFFIRRCTIFFLIFELVVFIVLYCFGPKSIKTLYDIHRNKTKINKEILQLMSDNQMLHHEIERHQSSFAQERIARERLLMKRDDETVYFIKK